VPNTIQIGDPSSAPLVPRPRLTPPPKSTPSGQTPSPAVVTRDPLTTGGAFLRSSQPPRTGRGGLAIGLVLAVLGIGIIGLAASHYLGTAAPTAERPTPAASPPPHVEPIPPPEPLPDAPHSDKTVTTTTPAPPSTGSAHTVARPGLTFGRPPPPSGSGHRPPSGGKSTDPFDQRF
jgi:hypothetical protein